MVIYYSSNRKLIQESVGLKNKNTNRGRDTQNKKETKPSQPSKCCFPRVCHLGGLRGSSLVRLPRTEETVIISRPQKWVIWGLSQRDRFSNLTVYEIPWRATLQRLYFENSQSKWWFLEGISASEYCWLQFTDLLKVSAILRTIDLEEPSPPLPKMLQLLEFQGLERPTFCFACWYPISPNRNANPLVSHMITRLLF